MLGADAEFLLKNNDGYVSSIGLIGGSKLAPRLVDGGNLQEDNVLAEIAIDPAASKEEFRNNIIKVFGILQVEMKQYDLDIEIKPSATFPAEQLDHPLAAQFGCDPDYNAYTFQRNVPPDPEKVGALRSCGGHVHVSFEEIEEDPNAKAEYIRILDLILGVPSVIMDTDKDRRKLYGKAGAYRSKPYGVEYRTLSNFWTSTSEKIDWVWDQVTRATELFHEGFRVTGEVAEKVINCINNGDEETALSIVHEFDLEVV